MLQPQQRSQARFMVLPFQRAERAIDVDDKQRDTDRRFRSIEKKSFRRLRAHVFFPMKLDAQFPLPTDARPHRRATAAMLRRATTVRPTKDGFRQSWP